MGKMREWIEEAMPSDVTDEQLRAGFVRAVATLSECRSEVCTSNESACPLELLPGPRREPCAGCFVRGVLEADDEPRDLACCWVSVLLNREPDVAAALRVWNIGERVPGRCRWSECVASGPMYQLLHYQTDEPTDECVCAACGRVWYLDEAREGGETDGE